jgi:hypothetical protein
VTSIAAWAGVDTHGVASLYVASDSRITWTRSQRWDQGRKVFACKSEPHIFGYWGDVLFPALALPVVVDRLDRGLLSNSGGNIHDNVEQAIRRLWSDYPPREQRDLGLIHGCRYGEGTNCTFDLAITTYEMRTGTWATRQIPMPTSSALLTVAGSGAVAVRKAHDLWQASHAAQTSRAVFSAFCESVTSKSDPDSGGAPQLAGLYRKGPGILFGIIHEGKRYSDGAALTASENPEAVEWRNHLFERVGGTTKRRLPGAQRHAERT